MIVLGIETSCDETSVSIVEKKTNNVFGKLLSENTFTQIKKHLPFGGVVPELASREHSKILDFLVKKTLRTSKIDITKIDAFAATTGPGLLGGLLIGSNYAKALSLASNKPFLSINHLQAHILVSRMKKKVTFPFLSLLVSGGHTQIVVVESYKKFKVLGETLDDALGEAFDKTAKLLDLNYPGGPEIEKLALKSKKLTKFNLPRPLINSKNCNFSFSGLKTAIRRIIQAGNKKKIANDLANEFQIAISDCLLKKVEIAIDYFKTNYSGNFFLLVGGVASNNFIRKKLSWLCKKKEIVFFAPEPKLCVDNATMVAWAGVEKLINGEKGDSLESKPLPRWNIECI